jgi:hypothetical protein
VKSMWMWMNENQACCSQVHVTAFRCLKVNLKKRVLNRQLRPILWGGGPGSHPKPNHVIGKQSVNMTLAKSHHAPTWHTARNVLIFSDDSSTPINYTLLFFDWGRRL